MSNLNLLYQSLLAETDNEARDEYQVDPRVALYATRDTEGVIEPFEPLEQYAQPSVAPLISTITQDELDTLAIPQLEQPNWKKQKTTVIIDSAQRDWTLQPDAYSNIFGFNTQLEVNQIGGQTPFYFNNDMIPYSAWEMPTPVVGGPYVQQQANNVRRIIPGTIPEVVPPAPPGPPQYPSGGSLLNTEQYGLRANTYGWSLVTLNGQIVHSDQHPTASVATGYTIVYFPVYDSVKGRGRLIGVDPAQRINADIQETFSTQLQLSNVASMRLVRATLPVRKFDTFNPTLFTNTYTLTTSGTIINTNNGNLLNTFHSEPYVLLSIGNLQGGYYGAGQVIQNAFAALVQKQRIPSDGNQTSYLAQFQDYFPWGDEAYIFDPPLSLLSNAQISLSNSYGQPFSHLDDMVVTTIEFSTDHANNISPNSFGLFNMQIYHGSNVPPNRNPFIDVNSVFSVNEIRAGDELVFYPPAIANIVRDPSCSLVLSNFLTTLGTHNAVVTSVLLQDAIVGTFTAPTLQTGWNITATIKYSNLPDAYAVLSNMNTLVTTLPPPPGGKPTVFFVPFQISNQTFSQPYLLPFMNRMMQTTYSFEVETLVPDTTDFGKIVAK